MSIAPSPIDVAAGTYTHDVNTEQHAESVKPLEAVDTNFHAFIELALKELGPADEAKFAFHAEYPQTGGKGHEKVATTSAVEGCRAAVAKRVEELTEPREQREITPAMTLELVRGELQKWVRAKEVKHLEWQGVDHLLSLRSIGPKLTEVVLTVNKKAGMQQIVAEVPMGISQIEHAWNGVNQQAFKPILGKKDEGEDLFYDERELFIPGYGKLLWVVRHHLPNGESWPEDLLIPQPD
jgi:hypothetical protein